MKPKKSRLSVPHLQTHTSPSPPSSTIHTTTHYHPTVVGCRAVVMLQRMEERQARLDGVLGKEEVRKRKWKLERAVAASQGPETQTYGALLHVEILQHTPHLCRFHCHHRILLSFQFHPHSCSLTTQRDLGA